jgi:hypothetical protein
VSQECRAMCWRMGVWRRASALGAAIPTYVSWRGTGLPSNARSTTATINASHLSHSNDTDNDTGERDQSLQCSQTITAIWHCLLLFSAKTCATAGGNCSWRPCVDHTILGELAASCATFPFPKARVGRSQMFFAPHHTPRLLSMQPRWETLQLCRVLLLHASLLSTFAVRAVRPIGREAGEAALQLATRYRFARVNPGVGHGAVT